jgi:hypothetical protein
MSSVKRLVVMVVLVVLIRNGSALLALLALLVLLVLLAGEHGSSRVGDFMSPDGTLVVINV